MGNMRIELLQKESIEKQLREKSDAYLDCYINIKNAKELIRFAKKDLLPRDEVTALRKLAKEEQDEMKRKELERKVDEAINADNTIFTQEQGIKQSKYAMKVFEKNILELQSLLTNK